jgi:hypothetical protein
MGELFNNAFPKHVTLDAIADDVTDEELLTARALCFAASDRARVETILADAGATGPFVTKIREFGCAGAHGQLCAAAALKWVPSNA